MPSSTSKSTPPSPSALSNLITSSGPKSAAESLAISIVHNLQHQHNWTELKLHLISPDHGLSQSHASTTEPSLTSNGLIDLDGLNFNHSTSSPRSASPSQSASSSGSTTPTTSISNGTPSLSHVDDGSFNAHLNSSSPPPLSLPLPQRAPSSHTLSEPIPIISGLPPQHSYIHPDLQTYLIKHKRKDTDLSVQREFVLPLALGEKWTLRRFCGVFDSLPHREVLRVHPDSGGGGGGGGGSGARNAAVNGNTATARRVYEHKDQKRVLLGMRANEGSGGDGTVVYYIMQEGEVKPRQNG